MLIRDDEEKKQLISDVDTIQRYNSLGSELESWREYEDIEKAEVSHDYVGTTIRPIDHHSLASRILRFPHYEIFLAQINRASDDRGWNNLLIAFVVFFLITLLMRILTHPVFTKSEK